MFGTLSNAAGEDWYNSIHYQGARGVHLMAWEPNWMAVWLASALYQLSGCPQRLPVPLHIPLKLSNWRPDR